MYYKNARSDSSGQKIKSMAPSTPSCMTLSVGQTLVKLGLDPFANSKVSDRIVFYTLVMRSCQVYTRNCLFRISTLPTMCAAIV